MRLTIFLLLISSLCFGQNKALTEGSTKIWNAQYIGATGGVETTSLNAALSGSNKTVIIGTGTHLTNQTLQLTGTNITVIMQEGAIIRPGGTMTGTLLNNAMIIKVSGNNNKMEGGRVLPHASASFNLDAYKNAGIYITGSRNFFSKISVEMGFAYDVSGYGFWFGEYNLTTDYNTVENCYLNRCGIMASESGANYTTVSKCKIDRAPQNAIRTTGNGPNRTRGVRILDNDIFAPGWAGCEDWGFRKMDGTIIRGNRCDSAGKTNAGHGFAYSCVGVNSVVDGNFGSNSASYNFEINITGNLIVVNNYGKFTQYLENKPDNFSLNYTGTVDEDGTQGADTITRQLTFDNNTAEGGAHAFTININTNKPFFIKLKNCTAIDYAKGGYYINGTADTGYVQYDGCQAILNKPSLAGGDNRRYAFLPGTNAILDFDHCNVFYNYTAKSGGKAECGFFISTNNATYSHCKVQAYGANGGSSVDAFLAYGAYSNVSLLFNRVFGAFINYNALNDPYEQQNYF